MTSAPPDPVIVSAPPSPDIVSSPDPVVIISKFGNNIVSTAGVAMKSGNVGDLLAAKNARSGKIIKGILKKDKKINVFF